tara:strand:- start:21224 stop:21691 length:468 start_codon:yes stop_codon:yes gene_type:complete
MKIKSNSLIVKMIQNSFWFIEKNIVPKPTTSCGLFLAGVVSGLWHVAYTFIIGLFLTGVGFALTFLISDIDLFVHTTNLPSVLSLIIMFGMVATMVIVFVVIPLLIITLILGWLSKKGVFSKVVPMLKKMFTMLTENPLTRKLSLLCKPIDYKDN